MNSKHCFFSKNRELYLYHHLTLTVQDFFHQRQISFLGGEGRNICMKGRNICMKGRNICMKGRNICMKERISSTGNDKNSVPWGVIDKKGAEYIIIANIGVCPLCPNKTFFHQEQKHTI